MTNTKMFLLLVTVAVSASSLGDAASGKLKELKQKILQKDQWIAYLETSLEDAKNALTKLKQEKSKIENEKPPQQTSQQPTHQPASAGAWEEHVFAPFIDMCLYPVPDLVTLGRERGVSRMSLGFIQAAPSDGSPAWAGMDALKLGSSHEQLAGINDSIQQYKEAGGSVAISLGGAAGENLCERFAKSNRTARQLADAYLDVVDTYSLSRLDFDLEGAVVDDAAAIELHSHAVALLQQSRPALQVCYTLPVLPSGLTASGQEVIRTALRAGAVVHAVNIMAMDYGDNAAPPTKSMGYYSEEAAKSTYAQMVSVFAEFGKRFGWDQLGVCPMIGVNDVVTEVFTLEDARDLVRFASDRGLGMISMWSMARDVAGPPSGATSSGILTQKTGEFCGILSQFGNAAPLTPAKPGEPGSDIKPVVRTIGTNATVDVTADPSTVSVFKFTYAWAQHAIIRGFEVDRDSLDFTSFWDDVKKPGSVTFEPSADGLIVKLPFNNQSIILQGVRLGQEEQIHIVRAA